MGINDLLVSYKLVHAPSYMQEPITEDPIEEPLINLENLERVQNRSKQEGFAGWIIPTQQSTQQPVQMETPTKGNSIFNKAMDSYLAKHPEDAKYRDTLTKIAEKESNFNPTIKNSASSASGYFLFIDSTRKLYSPNLTKELFLANPEELISAAVKLLKTNRKSSSKFANLRGLSQLQVDYGMWFSPKALTNYLKTGNSNFKDALGTSLMKALHKMA